MTRAQANGIGRPSGERRDTTSLGRDRASAHQARVLPLTAQDARSHRGDRAPHRPVASAPLTTRLVPWIDALAIVLLCGIAGWIGGGG